MFCAVHRYLVHIPYSCFFLLLFAWPSTKSIWHKIWFKCFSKIDPAFRSVLVVLVVLVVLISAFFHFSGFFKQKKQNFSFPDVVGSAGMDWIRFRVPQVRYVWWGPSSPSEKQTVHFGTF